MKKVLQLAKEFEDASREMQLAAERAAEAARELCDWFALLDQDAATKTEPCAPPEMAGRAPSTAPPYLAPYTQQLPSAASTVPNVPDGAAMAGVDGASPSKSRGEYTARQWLDSKHFDAFVKNNPDLERLEPLELTRLCDAFLASVGGELRQNRWGKTLKKFFAVWKAGS